MIAKVEDGDVLDLLPDLHHPSGGVACHKGLSYLDVHNDPDRLNRPRKRINSKFEEAGSFEDVDWDVSITDIGNRLRDLRETYGPDSIAVYLGNPTAFDSRALIITSQLASMVGSRMNFGANSQDTANKCYVAGAIYGSTEILTIPDLPNTDYFLCLGSNPKVSRWTIMSAPNDAGKVLKEITARGGRVRFVNPRKIETSTAETGETLLIKPGTDVYFLAALLNEVLAQGDYDKNIVEKYGKNFDGLADFVAECPAERASSVTGIDASIIREEANAIISARSAAFYLSTGVNQSRQGTLSYWLMEMLCFVTGNLGQRGGNYKSQGYFNHPTPMNGTQVLETSVADFELPDPAGPVVLPATMLPDLIENGDIRAMITICGNPALSVPGGKRLTDALRKLDTLVSVDILPGATAELSDYALPATDFLEREDVTLLSNGGQPIPYVQYTDAMTEPKGERRDTWWILSRIVQAMGIPSPLDLEGNDDGFLFLNQMLGASNLSIDELRNSPDQTAVLPESDREAFYENCVLSSDGKIDCCPESFERAGLFDRCRSIYEELVNESEDQLRLISLRTPYMHNSWLANAASLRRGKQRINSLHMCTKDATRRGLFDGDTVTIRSSTNSVETTLLIDNDLRSGAVALSHGYGHQGAPALRIASKRPGVNYNALMPSGRDAYEPLSYMSWISGVPVSVERAGN